MEIHESNEKVRIRAHQLWEQAGKLHGHDLEHWFQAEKELLLNSVAVAPLANEAKQEFSSADSERKPAKKTKAENSAPKAPKKSSGRTKSK
jgi:hypothetical protein